MSYSILLLTNKSNGCRLQDRELGKVEPLLVRYNIGLYQSELPDMEEEDRMQVAFPSLMLIKDGETEPKHIATFQGYATEADIIAWLNHFTELDIPNIHGDENEQPRVLN